MPSPKPYDKHLCPRCETNPAAEPHPCPYSWEIYGDHETLCDCCPDCEQKCANDI